MARGRFISATLGGSRKFARLASDTHRMIYMLLIPSADAYGRVDVDPVTLSGHVLTRLGIAPDVVNEALADMHHVGLLHLYEVGEDHYAEIVGFHEHNDIDLSREAQAIIPDARGVVPPEKPPRGTKRADADPRVWSGDYLAAGAAEVSTVPPLSDAALAVGSQVPHAVNQRQSNPSAIRVEGEVEVEVEVEERTMSTRPPAEPTPTPPVEGKPRRPSKTDPPPDETITLADLIGVWNEERGQLRAVRDADVALADANLVRLAERFVHRHRKRGRDFVLDLFRRGIAAVRIDPHWLGSRADKPTRTGPPYGIDSYLRHVETKADAAADLAAGPPRASPTRVRPVEDGDILQHDRTNDVATVMEVLPGQLVRMSNGETWNPEECTRCNN